MSVVARLRSESPFATRDEAKEIELAVIKLTMNEKYFPKRYRFTLVQSIQSDVLEMTDYIIAANALKLNEMYFAIRQKYQKEAYIRCERLLNKLDLAERLSFQIPEGTLTDIVTRIIAEEKRITEWIKSDKERMNNK